MILNTTFAQLKTLSKNNNIIYTRKSFPTNFHLFKVNYRSTEKSENYSKLSTRNATHCNNRDDFLHLSFTLKVSIFSKAYI